MGDKILRDIDQIRKHFTMFGFDYKTRVVASGKRGKGEKRQIGLETFACGKFGPTLPSCPIQDS
jgi:hypothetical protein